MVEMKITMIYGFSVEEKSTHSAHVEHSFMKAVYSADMKHKIWNMMNDKPFLCLASAQFLVSRFYDYHSGSPGFYTAAVGSRFK